MSIPQLTKVLIRLQADLQAVRVAWALIGGLAVSVWAKPRTTLDVDVVIAVADDREAEGVARSMVSRGYRIHTQMENEEADRLSTLRFEPPGEHEGVLVDVLFASSGIETEVVEQARRVEVVPGLVAPLATIGHLLALKVLALRVDLPQERPQDFSDIRELLKVADGQELQRARNALDLISRRGYDRGKDLQKQFQDQLRQFKALQRDNSG